MLSYKEYLMEYKGEHEAPDKDNGAPLYDLTLNGVYPKDFYEKGISHYGDGIPNIDTESFSVIYSAKNRPNKLVKVYRAVPELNFEDKEKLKEFYNIIFYRNKYNFFPMNNKIVDEISNKINEEDYDELQREGYDGVILPDPDGTFDGFVFKNTQVKIVDKEKVD